jgi:hypothetical protein
MLILGKQLSTAGFITASIYLLLALWIFWITRGSNSYGEAGLIQVFITLPWSLVNIILKFIPLWIWIVPNTALFYLLGKWIEYVIKKF